LYVIIGDESEIEDTCSLVLKTTVVERPGAMYISVGIPECNTSDVSLA
jgi:hypothetical protein